MADQLIASTEHTVIVGTGSTGLSCARHLRTANRLFSVVDTRDNPPGLEAMQDIVPAENIHRGGCPPELFEVATEFVVSPGVPLDIPLVQAALDAGISVVGDVDLFMREAMAPVVGITGSNAKSTVTELVGRMATAAGLDVGVGGNLGTPALDLLAPERDVYVIELSSFQLERAGDLGLAVATVLNVTADHLDRHRDMPGYHQVKHRIFRGCQKVVIHRDDALTIPLVPAEVEMMSWRLGEPDLEGFGLREVQGEECLCQGFEALLPVDELALPGRHNVANALAALALGRCAGLPMAAMLDTLRVYRGLPHRCELVAELDGVRYVNDSKGTNIGATEAALRGLGADRNILLLAGGQAKGASFRQLQSAVAKHCKVLILFGEDADEIEEALAEVAPILRVESLEDGVAAARQEAEEGDCVLLSPACASFDMFESYQQRGDVFRRAVEAFSEVAA
ncbi:MAG: UDP-N-acetylmuramoyl-L-alanine--D-glutamate ligase [Pseudomonadota bacterium]